jgi:hypothetical protein
MLWYTNNNQVNYIMIRRIHRNNCLRTIVRSKSGYLAHNTANNKQIKNNLVVITYVLKKYSNCRWEIKQNPQTISHCWLISIITSGSKGFRAAVNEECLEASYCAFLFFWKTHYRCRSSQHSHTRLYKHK